MHFYSKRFLAENYFSALFSRATWRRVDSNSLWGFLGEGYILKHLSIVLDWTDVLYVVNSRLTDQLLQQFSSEAVHSGCYKSMAFNGWWVGLCLLGYCCQWSFSLLEDKKKRNWHSDGWALTNSHTRSKTNFLANLTF